MATRGLTRAEIRSCLLQAGAQLVICLLNAQLLDEAVDFVEWAEDNLNIDLQSQLPAELEED